MRLPLFTLHAALAVALAGCGPNAANIVLRKENQNLKDTISQLKRQHMADQQSLAVAAQQAGTTQPVATPEQLGQLFTVVDLKLGRLTGIQAINPDQPDQLAIKVEVAPQDDTGDTVKASGYFIIEATDPNQSPEPLLGRWKFGPDELKKLWYSTFLVYSYVLPCPLDKPPTAKSIRVKVRFIDLVTGRSIGPVERIIPNKPS
jgi:hypothetical protein